MKQIFVVTVAAGLLWSPGAYALKWVDAGGDSCKTVCESAGAKAVSSGNYKNGNPFFVCANNSHNEGLRPGYNLQPDWAHACTVGYGGREESRNPYKCLCE